MQAEILMIGTELLLGQIEDTNATFIARELAAAGINLYQKTTVGDNRQRIISALEDALKRSDVVLCSGGLGPTEDDLTRDCVAEVYGKPLEFDEEVWTQIEAMFARYRFQISENNKRQAMVPRDGIVVLNPMGTAPGLIMENERGMVACMPGVPRELQFMLTQKIIPYVRDKYGIRETIQYKVLKVCGLGESRVDEAIGDLIVNSDNPTVGVLANPAAVRIRIAARATNLAEAEALIAPMEAEVRKRLPGMIMGTDEDTLEGVVDGLLRQRGMTLALAETFTGGMICQRLVAAGANQFAGGRVYPIEQGDNAKAAAIDLANRALLDFAATSALAVVADAAEGHAVVVFVHPEGTVDWAFGRAGTDERIQMRATIAALEYVRRHLSNTA